MNKDLNRKMISWIGGHETGASSITIWSAIMDIENYYPSVPYDVYDFRRCHNLLNLCDETEKKTVLKKLANRYDSWKPFSQNWDKLTELYKIGNMKEFNELLNVIIGR